MRIILILSTFLLSSCTQPPDCRDVLADDVELSWYYDKDGDVVWVQCEKVIEEDGLVIIERLTNCVEI